MPPHEVLLFNFRPDVSRLRQDELLALIEEWQEVSVARRVNPEARRPELARMSFVELADGADVVSLGSRLSAIAEIEMTAAPARRGSP